MRLARSCGKHVLGKPEQLDRSPAIMIRMVRLNTRGYSRIVLSGVQARGHSLATVRRATGVSADHLIGILDGRREFTEPQLDRLESLTGIANSRLAAFALEPDGGPLTELTEILQSARLEISGAARRKRAKSRRPSAKVAATSAR